MKKQKKSIDGRKLKRFRRICTELSVFMANVHRINPNIELLIAGEGGASALLIDTQGKGPDWWRDHQEETILESVDLLYTDCGGI